MGTFDRQADGGQANSKHTSLAIILPANCMIQLSSSVGNCELHPFVYALKSEFEAEHLKAQKKAHSVLCRRKRRFHPLKIISRFRSLSVGRSQTLGPKLFSVASRETIAVLYLLLFPALFILLLNSYTYASFPGEDSAQSSMGSRPVAQGPLREHGQSNVEMQAVGSTSSKKQKPIKASISKQENLQLKRKGPLPNLRAQEKTLHCFERHCEMSHGLLLAGVSTKEKKIREVLTFPVSRRKNEDTQNSASASAVHLNKVLHPRSLHDSSMRHNNEKKKLTSSNKSYRTRQRTDQFIEAGGHVKRFNATSVRLRRTLYRANEAVISKVELVYPTASNRGTKVEIGNIPAEEYTLSLDVLRKQFTGTEGKTFSSITISPSRRTKCRSTSRFDALRQQTECNLLSMTAAQTKRNDVLPTFDRNIIKKFALYHTNEIRPQHNPKQLKVDENWVSKLQPFASPMAEAPSSQKCEERKFGELSPYSTQQMHILRQEKNIVAPASRCVAKLVPVQSQQQHDLICSDPHCDASCRGEHKKSTFVNMLNIEPHPEKQHPHKPSAEKEKQCHALFSNSSAGLIRKKLITKRVDLHYPEERRQKEKRMKTSATERGNIAALAGGGRNVPVFTEHLQRQQQCASTKVESNVSIGGSDVLADNIKQTSIEKQSKTSAREHKLRQKRLYSSKTAQASLKTVKSIRDGKDVFEVAPLMPFPVSSEGACTFEQDVKGKTFPLPLSSALGEANQKTSLFGDSPAAAAMGLHNGLPPITASPVQNSQQVSLGLFRLNVLKHLHSASGIAHKKVEQQTKTDSLPHQTYPANVAAQAMTDEPRHTLELRRLTAVASGTSKDRIAQGPQGRSSQSRAETSPITHFTSVQDAWRQLQHLVGRPSAYRGFAEELEGKIMEKGISVRKLDADKSSRLPLAGSLQRQKGRDDLSGRRIDRQQQLLRQKQEELHTRRPFVWIHSLQGGQNRGERIYDIDRDMDIESERNRWKFSTAEERFSNNNKRFMAAANYGDSVPEAARLTAAERALLEDYDEQDSEDADYAPLHYKDPTQKLFVKYAGGYVSALATTMIGRRPTDEDAIVVNMLLKGHPHACLEAIFDGHGGHQTAQFAARYAGHFFGRLQSFDPETLKKACLDLDAAILKYPEMARSGSTGIFVFIERITQPTTVTVVGKEIVPEHEASYATVAGLICEDEADAAANAGLGVPSCSPEPQRKRMKLGVGSDLFKVTVANIGDSRAMLIHDNGHYTRLSRDHKPSVRTEALRIEEAGGYVNFSDTYRVNGIMSLSRAFGDADMKNNYLLPYDKQLVIAVPDVHSFVVKTSDVLLIACDGLFEPDAMTTAFVAKFIHQELKREQRPERILLKLLDTAYEYNSGDNVSAVLTFFREQKAAKELRRSAIVNGKGKVLRRIRVDPGDQKKETMHRKPTYKSPG